MSLKESMVETSWQLHHFYWCFPIHIVRYFQKYKSQILKKMKANLRGYRLYDLSYAIKVFGNLEFFYATFMQYLLACM